MELCYAGCKRLCLNCEGALWEIYIYNQTLSSFISTIWFGVVFSIMIYHIKVCGFISSELNAEVTLKSSLTCIGFTSSILCTLRALQKAAVSDPGVNTSISDFPFLSFLLIFSAISLQACEPKKGVLTFNDVTFSSAQNWLRKQTSLIW